jgi:hypothetical protein
MALFMDPRSPATDLYHSQALSIIGSNHPVDKAQLDTGGQFVRISLNNDSATDIPNVFVQYWVCAFNAGFSKHLFLPSALGTVGRQIPAGGSSNEIVEHGVNHTVQDPNEWKPTTSELDAAGLRDPNDPAAEIHACLLANVFSPQDRGSAKIDAEPPVLDLTNPHHAQRNIALFYAQGQAVPAVPMNLWMHVGNPDPESEREVQLTIRETHLRKGSELEANVADHLLRNARIERTDASLAPDAVAGIGLLVDGELQPIRLAREPLDDLRIEAGKVCDREPTIELGPDGFLGIRLQATLPEDERGANVLRIFDVVQRFDGTSVGEARVLFLNVPEETDRDSAYAA